MLKKKLRQKKPAKGGGVESTRERERETAGVGVLNCSPDPLFIVSELFTLNRTVYPYGDERARYSATHERSDACLATWAKFLTEQPSIISPFSLISSHIKLVMKFSHEKKTIRSPYFPDSSSATVIASGYGNVEGSLWMIFLCVAYIFNRRPFWHIRFNIHSFTDTKFNQCLLLYRPRTNGNFI